MKKENLTEKDLTAMPFEELLSAVLRHPDIPDEIDDAIQDALVDMFNMSDRSWVKIHESSPEYLASLIQCHARTMQDKEADAEWPGQLSLVG